ncbi:carboxymuconolactone decarboxylase family protein [Blastochloris viridis]|uniref:Alkyl hydroperoxide reductase AhpD n=1 Tax=Blastochloris viridis TaxID=1079 RepID=A0A0H5B8P2_BLAVI|nr:carboxymuconolactone decarboxylase family protein [Blastochloris viridis]ALK08152.1 Alkyl hydroperoxide reductase AhpD [Blastochloris viridis]BAR98582.1 alkylhydroperoxidase protein D [Blastochloris viridis]CUU44074.1 Alkyl hydroperoxide reductase AhpD [Blastochloris viridis]
MSQLEGLRQQLPDYARDLKLNLGTLLGAGGVADLSAAQAWGSALAAAIACRQPALTAAVEHDAAAVADGATLEAARTAAAIMAMTNVYYRAVHMAHDAELARLPAGLRMNGLTKHGIAPADFELFGLAASVVKGCEGCTKAHIDGARNHGVPVQAIGAVLRIAAVIHAVATVLDARGAAPAQPVATGHPATEFA